MSDSPVAIFAGKPETDANPESSDEWWQDLGLDEAPAEFVRTHVSFDSQKLQQIIELLSQCSKHSHSANASTCLMQARDCTTLSEASSFFNTR